MNDIETHYKAI